MQAMVNIMKVNEKRQQLMKSNPYGSIARNAGSRYHGPCTKTRFAVSMVRQEMFHLVVPREKVHLGSHVVVAGGVGAPRVGVHARPYAVRIVEVVV